MELRAIDVGLTEAEKYELVKRILKAKEEELRKVERQMREFVTEDAELEYLSSFIGAEYINPEGKNNTHEIAPLQQQREYLAYVITKLEEKQMELEQMVTQGGGAAQGAQQQTSPKAPVDPNKNMWAS